MEQYYLDRYKELNPVLRDEAIQFLAEYFTEPDLDAFEELINDYGENWSITNRWHFEGGMFIRNLLRKNGFGEEEFNIDNLDDYYTQLMEKALYSRRPRPDLAW